jgi:hyperosmotically inducible protein
MSRLHLSVLSLAAPFALGALLAVTTGCGGESQEQALEEATAALVAEREAVQESREEVAARQETVDEAQGKLAAAKEELGIREKALREAEARVGLEATDATLFRSVQRRLLDDEQLEALAIAVQVKNGVVSLLGTVPDEKDRARAEEVARATPGVVTIDNQIKVTAAPEKK